MMDNPHLNSPELSLIIIAVACVTALAVGSGVHLWALARLRKPDVLVSNFLGEAIPAGYGLILTGWLFAGGCLAFFLALTEGRLAAAVMFSAVLFGALGWLDDRKGSHGAGGFSGHLKALIYQRKITTGLIKAIGGGLTALAAAWLLAGADGLDALGPMLLVDALIIALGANFINLLDLRPGRAVWSFVVLWGLICGIGRSPAFLFVSLPVFIASLICGLKDSRGKWMMGDVGSNTLGACLGIGVVISFEDSFRLAILAVLIALHTIAERWSISRIIENNKFLAAIDRLTGVRQEK